MKVYSHYYKEENQEGLRWRTILQFGNSWDIIGSVVMKNPGSSVPVNPVIDKAILVKLASFDNSDDLWYEFTDDDTMRKVSVLFASYYNLEYVSQLNGIVQIFNLFYIMNPNEQQAEEELKYAGLPGNFRKSVDLLNYDIEHLVAPVYLGFGNLAFKDSFRDSAKKYFDSLFELGFPTSYLKERFEDNMFYHPQYLCGNGSNNSHSLYIRRNFRQKPLSQDSIIRLPKFKMPKNEILSIVSGISDRREELDLDTYKYNPKDNKTIRFQLPLNLQITITSTGNGYVGIRHLDHIRLKDYCQESFQIGRAHV